MKEIKNIQELRKVLCKTLIEVKSGSCDVNQATEVNNAAGKIVQTAKLEMDYARARKETPIIDFMGSDA